MSGDIDDVVPAPAAVEIVDVPNMTFRRSIALGDRYPTSLAVTPDGQRVWVADFVNGEVAAYDTETGQQLATVALPGAFDLAISADGSRVFVNADGQVAAIDTATNALAGSYATAPSSPLGIAVDGTGTRVAAVTTNGGTDPRLIAFDTSAGLSLLYDIPVAGDVADCDAFPNDVVFTDSDHALAWDSSCDSVYQFDLAGGTELSIVDTGRDSGSSLNSNNALVYSSTVGRAFVLNETQQILAIDPVTTTFKASPFYAQGFVVAESPEGYWTFASLESPPNGLAGLAGWKNTAMRQMGRVYEFSDPTQHVRDMRIVPMQ
jgi:DNA-binding beta-propeller fold protein YncE